MVSARCDSGTLPRENRISSYHGHLPKSAPHATQVMMKTTNTTACCALCKAECPGLLERQPHVQFLLHCQSFIELVRAGKLTSGLADESEEGTYALVGAAASWCAPLSTLCGS